MGHYRSVIGGQPWKGLVALHESGDWKGAVELAKIMDCPTRKVVGNMRNALNAGVVETMEAFDGGRRILLYRLTPGSTFDGSGREKKPPAEAVSVKRPAVARDVWQYAQGLR